MWKSCRVGWRAGSIGQPNAAGPSGELSIKEELSATQRAARHSPL